MRRLLLLAGLILGATRAFAAPIYAVDVSSNYTAAIADSRVSGGVLYLKWATIETADGVYDWSAVDTAIAISTAASKTYKLDLRAGINTPAWVYTAGAQSVSIIWDQYALIPPDWPALCASVKLPVPWDSTYQTKFKAAIDAMGAKYAADGHLAGIKLTGVNSYSDETFLPYHTAQTAIVDGTGKKVCYSNNDLANLNSAGYTQTNALNAFHAFNAKYLADFASTKEFAAEFIIRGFPNDTGLGRVFGSVERALDADARANVPYYVAQNNSWVNNFNVRDAEAYQEGSLAGSELATWVVQMIRARGCPRYWEVFDADIVNPANDNAMTLMYSCGSIRTTGGTW